MSLSLNVQCITVNGWMVNARQVNKRFELRTDFRWPHLFSVGVKKVLEEVGDRLICDVSTHHYVTPGVNLKRLPDEKKLSPHPLSFLKAPPYLLRCPSSSMISGMAEAKRARPTVRKRT